MVQVIQASMLTLPKVKEQFRLRQTWDLQFFPEWQQVTTLLAESEQQWLDQIRSDFLSIVEHSSTEEVVKLFVLSPLLSLAGLARYPFVPVTEEVVEILVEGEDELIRGKIDLLVLHQHLWIVVLEAKRQSLNVTVALPQALFHMMDSPNSDHPVYGLVSNGTEFLFLKLVRQEDSEYGLSRLFSLINPGNDLYAVITILKHLRDVVSETPLA